MICSACAAAGRHNTAGDGFDADILHSMCDNFQLYPESTPTWCDCGHVVTVPFEEPAGCDGCNGMDCNGCFEPLADWEMGLLDGNLMTVDEWERVNGYG